MNQRTKLVLASKHVNIIIHELIPWYIHSWYNYVVWSMRCNQFDYKWSILCLIRGQCLMKYVIITCIFASVYSKKVEVNNWIFNWWQSIAIKIKLFLIFLQHLNLYMCSIRNTSPILGPFSTKFKNTCVSKITFLV